MVTASSGAYRIIWRFSTEQNKWNINLVQFEALICSFFLLFSQLDLNTKKYIFQKKSF